MTVQTQEIAAGTGEHVVQFYAHDSELAQTVGKYLIDAVQSGAAAIVIATEAHRRMFEDQLEAAGIDSAKARRDGTLVSLDAAATLARFMSDGRIDGPAFDRVIGTVVREAAGMGRPICAYGEMVALLWNAGNILATIELERLWNELRRELPFSLWCAYHSESVSGAEHASALGQVCQLHSSVLDAPSRAEHSASRSRRSLEPEVSREFPAQFDAPGDARRFVADSLRQWGHRGPIVNDAQLVLSELATNAVLHARSPFSVMARFENSRLRISVRDASPVEPVLRDEAPMAPSGCGLRIVAALASRWGVEATADGKTVWAELRP